MVNSRQKGARGEREWRDELKKFGYEARRGQQFSGSPDSPDVVCKDLPIHWEVKLVENLNIYNAMTQALRDAPGTKIPAVAHKKNRKQWLVTLNASDFLSLVRKLYAPSRTGLDKNVTNGGETNLQSDGNTILWPRETD